MKNRKFKFFVPVSVCLLAFAAAFAFNSPKNENIALQTGYIFKSGVCQVDGKCANIPGPICTHNGMEVFELTGNSCINPLRGPWQP